jgi:hypothetical protein
MPYKYKKVGDKYIVYKKDTGKRVGSTGGNKESLRKYLAALHINAKEGVMPQADDVPGGQKATVTALSKGLPAVAENKKYTMKKTKEQIIREYIRKEIKKALREEESKPDYLDADKDGNKEEPMKKAFKDKEKND